VQEVGSGAQAGGQGECERLVEECVGGAHIREVERKVGVWGGGG
jgi:hypothetical protein